MKYVYYRIINDNCVWSLVPTGNYKNQRAPAQRRRLRQESGGDGEVEGRALDSIDELHRERIGIKGTDHVTPLTVRQER